MHSFMLLLFASSVVDKEVEMVTVASHQKAEE